MDKYIRVIFPKNENNLEESQEVDLEINKELILI
jgi:hypothetical protein